MTLPNNPTPIEVIKSIKTLEADTATKYVKPENGIPSSDLSQEVQNSLDKADNAIQVVSGSNGVTANAEGANVTVQGVTATKDQIGVAYLAKEVDCDTYMDDKSGTTPKAVKKAIITDVEALNSIFNATPEHRGTMSKEYAAKLEGLAEVATSGSYEDLSDKPVIPPTYTLHAATNSGLGGIKIGHSDTETQRAVKLSASDQAYVEVPAATDTVLGTVKLGSGEVQSVAVEEPTAAEGRTFPIQVNDSGNLVVNVPGKEITIDSALNDSSENPVQNKVINEELNKIKSSVTTTQTAVEKAQQTADSKYTKPAGNIPLSDLASSVQSSIGKIDSAVLVTEQTLSSSQQIQARKNIGAGISNFDGKYSSLTGTPTLGSLASKNTVGAADIADKAITSDKIADGTIVNSDISATAAIEQSKIKDLQNNLSTLTTNISAAQTTASSKYTKPETGIPVDDLAEDIQASLNKANNSVQYVSQSLTTEQQKQARQNIGAGTSNFDGKYSSLTGTPSSLPPTGAAGGDLTGTYPNPTIGAGKVAKTKLDTSVQTSLGKADTAVQPDDLADVATSGSYNDLTDTPIIPAIPNIVATPSGSGNAVTAVTASGHTLTVTKGAAFATKSEVDTKNASQDSAIEAAQSTANSAKTTADSALPKVGGSMTGRLVINKAGTAQNDTAAGHIALQKSGTEYAHLRLTASNSNLAIESKGGIIFYGGASDSGTTFNSTNYVSIYSSQLNGHGTVDITGFRNLKLTGNIQKGDSAYALPNSSGTLALLSDVNTKYTKPDGGIPKADLEQTIQTILDNVASTDELKKYLPLTGGTMQGELRVNGGDATGVSKIVLETNKGQITNSTTGTLFGYTGTNLLSVGHNTANLQLRGAGTRPTYNGNDLALYTDVNAKYTKPSGGIPTSDIADGAITSAKIVDGAIMNADINANAAIAKGKLSSEVQTSLNKADSALQSVPAATATKLGGIKIKKGSDGVWDITTT